MSITLAVQGRRPPSSRAEQRREKKKQHRSDEAQRQRTKPSQGVYVCIDWGASYWRHFTSVTGVCTVEPSLVVYDRDEKKLFTGKKASSMWLPSTSHVRFENLKRLFDQDSCFLAEERERIKELELEITMDEVLETWWNDRLYSLMKRVDLQETITIAVAHPAHFSAQSVQKLRSFFAQSRYGRTFKVVMSEEATAALHGSRYSGFKPGDVVLVLDGGKSTIVEHRCTLCLRL